TNLDAAVTDAASGIQPRIVFQNSADDVLNSGRFDSGTLLVMSSPGTGVTGAVVEDSGARALSTADLSRIVDSLRGAAPS
ncbi:hypothetical protein, partial [Escherichia coli]